MMALLAAACGPKALPEPAAAPATSVPTRAPTATPSPDAPAPTASASVPTPPAGEVVEGATAGGDTVPMGFTEDGAPYRGDPNAPVTLVEHSEFQ
jgi:hypothetical protein